MRVVHRPIAIPDFGVIDPPPALNASIYRERCRRAFAAAQADWLIVYADREHFANILFLSGFEPRFEEALLLLGKDDRTILITGNECVPYADVSPLPELEVWLAQTMSLLGQDRSQAPRLTDVLRDCGISGSDSVALVGWKYLGADEWEEGPAPSFVPAAYVAALDRVAGSVIDRSDILLHPETGQRSIIDADQIAVFEAAAARGSEMVWAIVTGTQPGERESDAAARFGYRGMPFNVHTMLTSGGPREGSVNGLKSPGQRRIARGDGISTAVGLCGGLTARAGLVTDEDAEFVTVASGYFAAIAQWYAAADIDVPGGEIHDRVTGHLADAGLRSLLNPGHLTGHEEWSHTPIRPGSSDRIRSGMHMQVDIIPTPMRDGWALNCEDSVVFADAALRSELAERHPQMWGRMQARRSFMRDTLGIAVSESVLPLSSVPACLAPLWLRSDCLLAVE
ncbi:Xaa-Pro aminopeptidase [Sphingomonas japonica]|uniref:Xaa-Pro aminopeptidase n=1 Tax=Sphingomonas japonica TaxID=511662 RepID=A0ABX0U1P6_9SPHN|nr:Xaa-Pro aminopeptidase [Sphingomonas japonica]NIJ22712.1 hypothetical protein [Sphingomonas japonica]